ncbi:hypothetical protein PIB30_026917 [Stylosanthes scabra]|uniref:Uncharacterized protein n=1 Tax=Stylosanthes scabra TaxID=79078 RepID=A0ABU6X826_9FABA|nr:hypothetical protein [Stylosanthes scabra]
MGEPSRPTASRFDAAATVQRRHRPRPASRFVVVATVQRRRCRLPTASHSIKVTIISAIQSPSILHAREKTRRCGGDNSMWCCLHHLRRKLLPAHVCGFLWFPLVHLPPSPVSAYSSLG